VICLARASSEGPPAAGELIVKVGAGTSGVADRQQWQSRPAAAGRDGPAGLGSFTLDPQGRITAWSVTAARLFGPTAAEAVGQHVCDVLPTVSTYRQLISQY
jgi:PAS domain-containing protein